MSIPVKCPNSACGKEYTLGDELVGKTVKCTFCRQVFTVPAAEGFAPQPAVQSAIPNPQSAIQDPLIGAKIAHYRIQALLGEGGMGKVYKAHNTSLDKTCAIKILPQEFAKQDQANIDRFVREARSAARVEHTNVLPVQFVGKVAEHYFIEMQYVDGGTLQGVLKEKGKLEVKEAAQIIRDVAAGLQAAHEKGIVHRDMKPTNVMLTSKGHVYVMDFGLAKMAEARTALTQQGYILGTPLYMSPEQAMSQPVDHRSDIYSLGVMFYQLATGTPPYTANSPVSLLYMHQHAPIPDIHQVAPEIPQLIAEMIRKMMAKNAADRYQSCAEIVDELNGFLTTGGATVTVSEETLKDAPDHRKSVLQQAKRGAPSRPPTAFPSGAAQKPGFFSAGRLGRPRYFEKPGFLGPIAGAIGIVVLLLIAGVYLLSRSRTTKPAPPVIASSGEPRSGDRLGALGATKQSHAVETPSAESAGESAWDEAYVATAATGEKIPHPLSRKTHKETLADGTTVDVPEGMVYVPAGEFTMGVGDRPIEGPAHPVYLDAYFIGKYEVTNAEWKAFVDATWAMEVPQHWKNRSFPEGKDNHPVVYVSWEDAQKYCAWVSKETGRDVRLPTEAQWEKAARGPRGFTYPWGNDWNPMNCNWRGTWAAKYGLKCSPTEGVPSDQWNAFVKTEKYTEEINAAGGNTTPVGSFPEGKCYYGCYDMAGNADEWCADWFMTNYFELKGAKRNPEGPTEEQAEEKDFWGKKSKAHLLRGGSWNGNSFYSRAVYRGYRWPSNRENVFGFRVVVRIASAAAAGLAPFAGGATGTATAMAGASAWDDAYVTTAATGDKIPHPLSRRTYKQTLADGTAVDVPEGMVYVPAGEFTMGSGKNAPEGPEHKVYLDGYLIGKYEVTNAEWKVFADWTGAPKPSYFWEGEIPKGRENYPVCSLSWEMAKTYCDWVSKTAGVDVRLPTEAQWEKAARGLHGFKYPWGDDWEKRPCNSGWMLTKLGLPPEPTDGSKVREWYRIRSEALESPAFREANSIGGNTTPVGSFPEGRSPFGCYDMAGNVAERCSDWYKSDYYLQSPPKNPMGPSEEQADSIGWSDGKTLRMKAKRGGSWSDKTHDCNSVRRICDPTSYHAVTSTGLRVVRLHYTQRHK